MELKIKKKESSERGKSKTDFWDLIRLFFFVKGKTLLPKEWKHDARHIYEAKFVLPPYLNHSVRLVALPIDDVLCINAIAANMSPKNVSLRSLAVNSSRYVPRYVSYNFF